MELKPIVITGRPVGVIESDRWFRLGDTSSLNQRSVFGLLAGDSITVTIASWGIVWVALVPVERTSNSLRLQGFAGSWNVANSSFLSRRGAGRFPGSEIPRQRNASLTPES